ncbi:hypothetical protein CONLIGDRAFT_633690 [Coniochaeta ligniaria NRRL 30616]|uniref:Uncharacterized protein n=1 Tax=Coniochaeta ligniaria NRRL 30616 TaxID=1408157 RepID=A0A1J7JDK9_9PEZI|nr:hypothetical protein CONLIGDRAFT_633690 [Coniochaeta ligniaria NRRL 30616]
MVPSEIVQSGDARLGAAVADEQSGQISASSAAEHAGLMDGHRAPVRCLRQWS